MLRALTLRGGVRGGRARRRRPSLAGGAEAQRRSGGPAVRILRQAQVPGQGRASCLFPLEHKQDIPDRGRHAEVSLRVMRGHPPRGVADVQEPEDHEATR